MYNIANKFVEIILVEWNKILLFLEVEEYAFVLGNTGNFKVDFEYVNIKGSGVITRCESWENRYL